MFLVCEVAALGNLVPALQAGAAAGGGRVLGDEDWMTAVRGLLAVVARFGGGQALRDQVTGVLAYGGWAAEFGGGAIAAAQA